MAESKEPLTPAAFTPQSEAAPTMATSAPRASGGRRRMVYISLALVAACLALGWWLAQRAPTVQMPQATGAPPTATADHGTPFEQAQRNKRRAKAQEVLEALLAQQNALESRGAPHWASEIWSQALDAAREGDDAYRQGQFDIATTHYQSALSVLQQLNNDIDTHLQAQLKRATEALNALQENDAKQALDWAQKIAPGEPALASLEQRLRALPELKPLLEEADSAINAENWPQAIATLERARGLDPEHPQLDKRLAELRQRDANKRYQDAMSAGYKALNAGQHTTAIKHFTAAKAIRADTAAINALAEANNVYTAQRVKNLRTQAKKAEAAERWQQAHDAYAEALRLDASLLYASEGKQRTAQRLKLNGDMQNFLAKPSRLSDEAVARQARDVLARAKHVKPVGTQWQKTLSALERAITLANTPLTLTITSDEKTDIVVFRVAKLGRLRQTQLTLKPGTYTLRGSRRGYRDVRKQITIKPGQRMSEVYIACREPI